MKILALDPGPEYTAAVLYNAESKKIINAKMYPNNILAEALNTEDLIKHDICVCEHIESFGMPVGNSVFETAYWIGHFRAICLCKFERIYRHEEKMYLCNSVRAKDSNIRQALIDRFPAIGGGKIPQIGTKKRPGPLYGISGDLWSALAVAVTYAETKLKPVLLSELTRNLI